MSEPPTHRVLARLGSVRKHGGSYMAKCPAHPDGNPSLSVGEGDDGRAVLHCFAGCPPERVLEAIGLDWNDLFPAKTESNGHASQELATYDYVDEAGQLLYQVVRVVPKGFRQRRPDGSGGWVWRLGDVRRVLYRLPDVVEAIATGRTVFVTEGEKDSDSLARAGHVATTNPGGAGKWRLEYTEALRGATEVVIVADRDDPGRAHAAEVASSLRGVASVRVVEPAVGKDVTDHLLAGKTVEEFVACPEDAQVVPKGLTPRTRASSTSDEHLRDIKLVKASDVRPEHTRWMWVHRIVLRGLTLAVGMEGTGKSTLLASLIAQVTRGTLEGDLRGEPAAVVYVTAEDSIAATVVPRLMAAGADLPLVHFVNVDGFGAGGLSIPADLPALAATMAEARARLLVLDPVVAHLHGTLDSHRDQQVRQALTPLAQWADTTNAAALGVMHFNKGISTEVLDRVNGSRGFTAAARSVLTIGVNPDDETERVVAVGKSNLAPMGVPSLRFRIEGRSVDHPAVESAIETSGVAWLGEAKGITSRDLLAGAVSAEDRSARQEAAEWLYDLLAEEPVPATEVKLRAEKAGLAWATVRRAKGDIGVASKRWGRPGEEGGWCWSLVGMDAEDAHAEPNVLTTEIGAPSGSDEHLHASQLCHVCTVPTVFSDDRGRPWCTECELSEVSA